MANEVNRRGFFAGVAGLLTLLPGQPKKPSWGRLCDLPEIGTEWNNWDLSKMERVHVFFPDGSTLSFNGTLKNVTPSGCVEGEVSVIAVEPLNPVYIEGAK